MLKRKTIRKVKRVKPRIEQVIVVEGRDDTAAIKAAINAETIETHGFGITEETFSLIKKAYEGKGIIVFTDPDHAGELIRKRILELFPEAGEAFLPRDEATKGTNIGIENAKPESIIQALSMVKFYEGEASEEFSMDDLEAYNLTGTANSKEKREKLGKALGIGYGNSKAFLRKLNGYGIRRQDFQEEVSKL